MGVAAETAEASVARDDLPGRWAAVCHAVRPGPGSSPRVRPGLRHTGARLYRVSATIAPAARLPTLRFGILADATDRLEPTIADDEVPPDAGGRCAGPVLIASQVPAARCNGA